MKRRRFRKRAATAGFTLIEALVATVLMGVVLTSLAAIAGQWLPNWNRGIARAQSSELIGVALDRLVSDVAASQFVTANRDATGPLFDGTPSALTFVRSALGPNARPGLEIVRIAEVRDGNAVALVRATAPFMPLRANGNVPILPPFADPIAMLRSSYRVSFAFAGPDGEWKDLWQNESALPAVVRVTLREAATGRPMAVSTAALIHVDMAVACLSGGGQGGQAQGDQAQSQGQSQASAQDEAGQVPGLGQRAQGTQAAQARGLGAQGQDGVDCSQNAPQGSNAQDQNDPGEQAAMAPQRRGN
jgi:general secretion pathway protein J